MHPSAMSNGKLFFDTYFSDIKYEDIQVVEIGSQDVNGSLREVCPLGFKYIGVDFQKAKGVDIVIDSPYQLPFKDSSVDIVLSSSCLEHSEMFWLVFLEAMRILKPSGLMYLNVPSSGQYHRYPVDCWRFYPDSGLALISWAKRNGFIAIMLESYVQKGGGFNDFVGVFLKNQDYLGLYQNRILNVKTDFQDGHIFGSHSVINPSSSMT